jgi:hypothetical protein
MLAAGTQDNVPPQHVLVAQNPPLQSASLVHAATQLAAAVETQ